MKVQHANGFDQWNDVQVRGDQLQLGDAQHLCGATLSARDVKMGPGGINGRWEGKTQILIGNDMTPDMDIACLGGDDIMEGSEFTSYETHYSDWSDKNDYGY